MKRTLVALMVSALAGCALEPKSPIRNYQIDNVRRADDRAVIPAVIPLDKNITTRYDNADGLSRVSIMVDKNIATGDVNGDGFCDLIVGYQSKVIVYRNDGDRNLKPAQIIDVYGRAGGINSLRPVALSDADEDGDLDLAVIDDFGVMSKFKNDGKGNFSR